MRIFTITAGALLLASIAYAHVTVMPRESQAGAEQRYTVRVPTEGQVSTTAVELEVPADVAIVRVEPGEGFTFETRREGDVLGASQSGFRSSLTMLRVLRDEDTIVAAREAATRLLERDPELTGAPELAHAVAELEQSRQSDFMEKA